MKDENTSTNIDIKDIISEKPSNLTITQLKKDINFFTKDFLFFKNDMLKELKNLDFKLEVQKRLNTELKNTLSVHDTKLTKLNNKLDGIANVVNDKEATTNYYKEKIDLFIDYKNKTENNLATMEYKIKLNSEELKNAINKYDKAIFDNLSYPGTIGRDSKFKDFHELIDYILNNIKVFNIFKEKNEVDLRSYKIKLDSMIKSINLQINGILGNANSFTTKAIKEVEKKCLDGIKGFDEKLMKTKVDNIELAKKFENEKNQIFEEWNNIKNMKKELVELIDTSIKKLNKSNNNIQKTLDNYENQFNEIKNSITSMNELYNKMRQEALNINNEDHQEYKINSTKSDFFKMSNSSYMNELNDINDKFQKNEKYYKGIKRIQSAKTILQNYIEGNSIYQELLEKNSIRCKQHENSESPIKIMMKKYYDEGINNIINMNAVKTIEGITNKNSITDRNKINQSMNSTPKTNINANKIIKQKLDEYNLNDNDIKGLKQYIGKNRKHSAKRKFILVKEGYQENNNNFNKKNKNKSKEADKRFIQQEIFAESFIDKSRLTKLKQLSSLSFLCDDSKDKKFPIIDNIIENNKNEEANYKTGKTNKLIKNRMEKLKFREYNVLSGFKNPHSNNPKSQKMRHRINSSEIIKHHQLHNNNENEKDNSLNNINIKNLHSHEKNKKIEEKVKKKRRSSEIVKKQVFKMKSEKSK